MKNDSEDVQAEKRLQDLIRQKEASIRAKGLLIDNMAYQIRTLSNAVVGFSDLLLTEKLSDELMDYVREINQAGNGLSALVNEVLDWARLESGRLQVSCAPCSLSDCIRRLEKMIAAAAAEKELDYEIQVDPDLPAQIMTDADRLLKCLINLAANAFKYTQKGFVRVRVLSGHYDDKPYVRFEINDSGVGMTADQIEHIFEPPQRAEDVSNEILTCLDMGFTVSAGLPLTKQLIELLGGTLTVTSEPNTGSTFTLILPTGLDADSVGRLGTCSFLPQLEETPTETAQTLPSILLVEDQQSNRMVIRLMLEALGMAVDTAEDGQEGVQKAADKKYDLILMDLKMPRMDGYQAGSKIRQSQPETPIVALSAKVFDEQGNQRITALFNGFLTKPVDSHKLSETIYKFITDTSSEMPPTKENESEQIVTFEYEN